MSENPVMAESIAPDKPVRTTQPNLGQHYVHALKPVFTERASSIY